jgi:hypothetical protein
MNILLSLVLALGSHVVEDPGSKENRIDYLVLAPAEFVDALAPLAEHRKAGGLRVGIVTLESIRKQWKSPLDFVRFASREWKPPSPRFLLLVGDADRIPPILRRSHYQTKKFQNDPELATDHLYGVPEKGLHATMAVGRFPADSVEEVAAMAGKTVRYEAKLAPGTWQKKIKFITGEAGFNPFIDAFIEKQFTRIVSDNIPPPYDIELAYSKTTSRYCPYPPEFNENAIRLLNDGSLFYVYVGHGFRRGFDNIRWKKEVYPIFNLQHVPRVEIRNGLPVMFVIACSTAFFDARSGDCIGEELFKKEKGPVAFIGGTRITQPYVNALIGKAMIAQVFGPTPPTLGEALIEAKKEVLGKDGSALRKSADRLAGMIQGPGNLEAMRKDGVLHYILLGDPALRLRTPETTVTLSCLRKVRAGDRLIVRGKTPFPRGTVTLQLDCLRNEFAGILPNAALSSPTFRNDITERYRAANDKRITSLTRKFEKGTFTLALPLPSSLRERDYFLKATVVGPNGVGLGWVPVECVEGN